MRAASLAFLMVSATVLCSGCGYKQLTRQDEDVKAAWSDVSHQYQRRAELIPTLLAAVQGYAGQQQRVLIGVAQARAESAGSIPLTPQLLNQPQAFARFQLAQNELSASLHKLFALADTYPDLQSSENFRDLQAQLEGTESRITLAQQRYIDAVRNFNTTVRAFPTNLTARMFDFEARPDLSLPSEQASPPSRAATPLGPEAAASPAAAPAAR
jgi:LemA protein